jgi:hypothetical protein
LRKPFAIAGHLFLLYQPTGVAMHRKTAQSTADDSQDGDDAWVTRYAILTFALFVPLLISFLFIRNLYPFAASTMMMAAGDARSSQTYYVLRGETVSGLTVDLPAVELTNALSNVTWGLVSATAENKAFSIRTPHPANTALVNAFGGKENLPPGVRVPDLLRSWGEIYNSRLPASSSQRLRAIEIDVYRWQPGTYGDYDTYVKTWRLDF